MKNVIVFLLALFAAPVWCVADIQLDKDGNYVEFAYATMSDGVKIAVAVGYPKGFDPQDQTQKWPAILEMSGYPNASQPVYRGDRYGENYITVSASIRGTGASGGLYAAFSDRTIQDGYEIIEDWEVADVDVTASATVTGTGATYDVTTVGATPPQVDITKVENSSTLR